MVLRLPRLNRLHDPVAISILLWKAAIVILTIVTSIFSYLAAVDAQSATCAGKASLMGYRSGISDFIAFPLLSSVAAVAFIIVLTPEKVKQYVLWDEREISRFRSIRITMGMLVLCFTLLCGVVVFGGPATVTVKRYIAIADYCLPAPIN